MKRKKIKGFTLIEILAVIVILAIIALIATPIILNVIDESRKKAAKNSVYEIINASKLYYADHVFDDTIPFETNILDILEFTGKKPDSGYVYMNEDGEVSLGAVYDKMCFTKNYNETELSINNDIENCKYVAPPPNNEPVLNNGLVAITISDDGTVAKANTSNSNWYNYDEKKWANAVVLDDKTGSVTKDNILAYYVWVPRYEYKTGFQSGNGNEELIEINFIDKDVTTPSDGYIIPPGFTFGDTNLSGIWVAKYEPSTTNGSGRTNCGGENCRNGNIIIKPGVTALNGLDVAESFYLSRSLENSYAYDLDGNSHMMKNSEWAAVAYLSHSKYGKGDEVSINNNINYKTGGGTGESYVSNISQSTTGNITGIYDMSGCSREYMMSSYVADENTITIGLSGFSHLPENKYFDIMYNTTLLGHALSETEGWYGDYSRRFYYTKPWLIRGSYFGNGSQAGLFYYSMHDGNWDASATFRPVFVEAD